MIRTLIVNDEPLARTAIRNMLRHHADVAIAGECESGAEAVAAIASHSPSLVFLDLQMPEMDGFGVLQALERRPFPQVIFVTAFDRYAVRAFETHALDYLLKPFDRDRFDAALDRARQHWRQPASVPAWGGQLDRVIIRAEGRIFFLASGEIDWIEAQGNYVNLHCGGRTHLLGEPVGSLESRLDPRMFRRISRSVIVNVDSIGELRPLFRGDYQVILRDGALLHLSHRYRANLNRNALGAL
jgi:two-component system, LytTR family, response regulator